MHYVRSKDIKTLGFTQDYSKFVFYLYMRITIIGSGNVATHLGAAFKNAGHRIIQVYSRQIDHAALLAYHLKAEAIADLGQIDPETDIFVISVKDDSIAEVAAALASHQKLIVHTSGATSLDTLQQLTPNAGVFYPLQTFSKTKELDFSTVPLCVEGATEEITALLEEMAGTITRNIYRVSSDQRKILHLAAVFACNFPNYLYHVAQQLLADHQLDFNLLRPLIMETAEKVMVQEPGNVQTGPAVRHDVKTMDAHLSLITGNTGLQEIYQLLSQGIIKMDKAKPTDK